VRREAVELADLARLGPALAVVAHPDDESFGLGALLAGLVAAGADVRVLCFTHGEASTLGAQPGLGALRRAELQSAGACLGLRRVVLDDRPDGALADCAPGELDERVLAELGDAALLVVFERSGVTGHPDHRAATAAALRVASRRRLPTLEWGVAPEVASVLNHELGTSFVGLDGPGTVDVVVDRESQRAAIDCHASQARDNPVLRRRLDLQGDRERVRLSP
jgi:LmbE family N-acetylglucosaminyl deacetylase